MTRVAGSATPLSSRGMPLSQSIDSEFDEAIPDFGIFDIGAASMEASAAARVALHFSDDAISSKPSMDSDCKKKGKVGGIGGKFKKILFGTKKSIPFANDTENYSTRKSFEAQKQQATPSAAKPFTPALANSPAPQSAAPTRQNIKPDDTATRYVPASLPTSPNSAPSDVGFIVTNVNLNKGIREEDPFLLEIEQSFSPPDFGAIRAFNDTSRSNVVAADPFGSFDFEKTINWEDQLSSDVRSPGSFFGFKSDPFMEVFGNGNTEHNTSEASVSREPLVKINCNDVVPRDPQFRLPQPPIPLVCPETDNEYHESVNEEKLPLSQTWDENSPQTSPRDIGNYAQQKKCPVHSIMSPGAVLDKGIPNKEQEISCNSSEVSEESSNCDDIVDSLKNTHFNSTLCSSKPPTLEDVMTAVGEVMTTARSEEPKQQGYVQRNVERQVENLRISTQHDESNDQQKDLYSPTGMVLQLTSKYESFCESHQLSTRQKGQSPATSTTKGFFPRTSPQAKDTQVTVDKEQPILSFHNLKPCIQGAAATEKNETKSKIAYGVDNGDPFLAAARMQEESKFRPPYLGGPSKVSASLAARVSKFNHRSQTGTESTPVKKHDVFPYRSGDSAEPTSIETNRKPFMHANISKKDQSEKTPPARLLKEKIITKAESPLRTNPALNPSSLMHRKSSYSSNMRIYGITPKEEKSSVRQNVSQMAREAKALAEAESAARVAKMKVITNRKSPLRSKTSSGVAQSLPTDGRNTREQSSSPLLASKNVHYNEPPARNPSRNASYSVARTAIPNKDPKMNFNMSSRTSLCHQNSAGSDTAHHHDMQMPWNNPIRRKLLSSIAIPIQTEFRRFHARQDALNRMLSIVIIQTCFRRWLAEYYFTLYKTASIQIQAVFRGWLVRDLTEVEHYCAALIQCNFRGHLARVELAYIKGAVVSFQAIVRGYFSRWATIFLHQCATLLQVQWRRYHAELRFTYNFSNVIYLQCIMRRHVAQISYEKMREAKRREFELHSLCATIIQSQCRCFLTSLSYLNVLADVLELQSFLRRFFATRRTKKMKQLEVLKKHINSIKIQSQWRSMCCYVNYVNDLADVLELQSVFRRWIAVMKVKKLKLEEMENQLEMKKVCATTIQSQWRSFSSSLSYLNILSDILEIQCMIRRDFASKRRKSLQRERELSTREYFSISIQTFWRSYYYSLKYVASLTDVLVLQTVIRRWLAKERRTAIHDQKKKNRASIWEASSIAIQANWRSFICSFNYLAALTYILEIQSQVRRSIAIEKMKAMREEIFLREKIRSATVIQTTFRSFCCSIFFLDTLTDILTLQCTFRQFIAMGRKKALQNEKEKVLGSIREKSSIIIQCYWRCFFWSEIYLNTLAEISVIQCKVRQWKAVALRDKLAKQRDEHLFKLQSTSATVIQSLWRSYDTTVAYLETLSDIILVQSMARRRIARRKVTKLFLRNSMTESELQCEYATLIQVTWRSFSFSQRYAQWRKNTIVLQSSCRRFLAMRILDALFLMKVQHSISIIQNNWRSHRCKMLYLHTMVDIITIQTIARQWIRKLKFARMCQLMGIRESDLRNFYASLIQCAWRVHIVSTQYSLILKCTIIAQNAVRQHIARKKFVNIILLRAEESAVLIQRAWRSHDCSIIFLHTLAGIVAIQTVVRRWMQKPKFIRMRMLRGLKENEVRDFYASLIQSSWRAHTVCSYYFRIITSTIVIQCIVRRCITQPKYEKALLLQAENSALVIQRAWRSHDCSILFLHTVAGVIAIQSIVRQWIKKLMYKNTLQKIELSRNYYSVTIQSLWRSHNTSSKFSRIKTSSIAIQSTVRQHIAQANFQKALWSRKEQSTLKIQSTWRSYDCSIAYLQTLGDVVAIQCLARQWIQSRRCKSMRMYRSAVVIQKNWRTYDLSTIYLQTLGDIVAFQSILRQRNQRRVFNRMRMLWQQKQKERQCFHASIIQRTWRTHVACTQYFCLITYAIVIQSNVRRCIAQAKFEEAIEIRLEASAAIIQKTWRSYDCSITYEQTLVGIVTIQGLVRMWHSNRLTKIFRSEYLKEIELRNSSACLLQRLWRLYNCSSNYYLVLAYVIIVQSVVRQSLIRKKFAVATSSIIGIQSIVRLWSSREKMRSIIRARNKCACRIQCIWRLHDCSSNYYLILAYVIVAQSAIRRVFAKHKFIMTKNIHIKQIKTFSAAIRIQSFCRSAFQHAEFRFAVDKVTRLQTFIRSGLKRRHFARSLSAIITTQSTIRMVQAKMFSKQILHIRSTKRIAAVKLQSLWRSIFQLTEFLFLLDKVTRLQTFIRSGLTRRHFVRSVSAIITTQSTIRMVQAKMFSKQIIHIRSTKARIAAVKLQSLWRSIFQLTEFLFLLDKVTRLQTFIRSGLTRRHFVRSVSAIITTQSTIRMVQAKMFSKQIIHIRSTKARIAAVKLQSLWRSIFQLTEFLFLLDEVRELQTFIRGGLARQGFAKFLSAIVIIQSTVRKFYAKQSLKQINYIKMHNAATAVQSMWRSKAHFDNFLIFCYKATQVQSVVRGWFSRQYFANTKREAVIIQALVRVQSAKQQMKREKENVSAIKIQSLWRTILQLDSFTIKCYEIARLQSIIRGYVQRQHRLRSITCVVSIQSAVRMFYSKHALQELQKKAASTTLQSMWRAVVQFNNFIRVLADIQVIQSSVRVLCARQRLAGRKKEVAASKLQSIWRSIMQVNNFLVTRFEITTLQAHIRGSLVRIQFAKSLACIVVLQSLVRIYSAKLKVLQEKKRADAATKLQSFWRTILKVDDFIVTCYEISRIQTMIRAGLRRQQFLKSSCSVLILQCSFRIYVAMKKKITFLQEKKREDSAIKLQSMWRTIVKVLQEKKRADAATKLQSFWRTILKVDDFIVTCYEISRIQTMIRAGLRRQQFLKSSCSVLILQCSFRIYVAMKKKITFLQEKKREDSAIKLQSMWRTIVKVDDFLVTCSEISKIQAMIRQFFRRTHFAKVAAATRIQSVWRTIHQVQKCKVAFTGIVMFQALIRGSFGRMRYARLRGNLLTLQCLVRTVSAKLALQKNRKITAAAIKLQSIWRTIMKVNNFLVICYEICRFQTIIRGRLERVRFAKSIGSILILQVSIRSLWARRELQEKKIVAALLANAVDSFMKRCSCKKIQFAWKTFCERRKERKAALVIERFFLFVQAEVEREILLQDKRRRKKMQRDDDDLLERIWLLEVTNNKMFADGLASIISNGIRFRNRRSPSSLLDRSTPRFPKSPHAYYGKPQNDEGRSSPGTVTRRSHLSQRELNDDLTMEEAWLEIKLDVMKKSHIAKDEYLTRNGLSAKEYRDETINTVPEKVPPTFKKNAQPDIHKYSKTSSA